MAQQSNQEAVVGLDRLIADARARLAANPDYIALKAFERARAEIVGVQTRQMQFNLASIEIEPGVVEPEKRVSQLKGAELTLNKAGHPLPIRELMEGAQAEGAVMGGDNPQVSFGSSLSKSDRFKSVRYRGEYAWWFADRPIPGGIARVRSTKDETKEAAE